MYSSQKACRLEWYFTIYIHCFIRWYILPILRLVITLAGVRNTHRTRIEWRWLDRFVTQLFSWSYGSSRLWELTLLKMVITSKDRRNGSLIIVLCVTISYCSKHFVNHFVCSPDNATYQFTFDDSQVNIFSFTASSLYFLNFTYSVWLSLMSLEVIVLWHIEPQLN